MFSLLNSAKNLQQSDFYIALCPAHFKSVAILPCEMTVVTNKGILY